MLDCWGARCGSASTIAGKLNFLFLCYELLDCDDAIRFTGPRTRRQPAKRKLFGQMHEPRYPSVSARPRSRLPKHLPVSIRLFYSFQLVFRFYRQVAQCYDNCGGDNWEEIAQDMSKFSEISNMFMCLVLDDYCQDEDRRSDRFNSCYDRWKVLNFS
jgi:hypothetical protein